MNGAANNSAGQRQGSERPAGKAWEPIRGPGRIWVLATGVLHLLLCFHKFSGSLILLLASTKLVVPEKAKAIKPVFIHPAVKGPEEFLIAAGRYSVSGNLVQPSFQHF